MISVLYSDVDGTLTGPGGNLLAGPDGQPDLAAIQAQQRVADMQGDQRTWYCGAWTGYGFHEDGLKSGLAVAQALLNRTTQPAGATA